MAKTYDTVELRRIASVLRESSDEISKTLRSTTQWIRDDVPEQLSGETADALAETADDINGQLLSVSKETDEIGLKLKQFANLLDLADRKAAEMINSR